MNNYLLILLCLFKVFYSFANPVSEFKKFEGINPTNFVTIGNRSYYIGPTDAEVTNFMATQFCNDDGMKLISFETEEKWLLISDYMKNNGYSAQAYWSSGRKFIGQFQWTGSGQLFTFTAWNTLATEPDAIGDYICVQFYPDLGWYDDLCSMPRSFMCEF